MSVTWLRLQDVGDLVRARVSASNKAGWVRGYVSIACSGDPGSVGAQQAFDFAAKDLFVVLERRYDDHEWKLRCMTERGNLWFLSDFLEVVSAGPDRSTMAGDLSRPFLRWLPQA